MERVPARRHLRLKEWLPLIDRMMRPTADYLAATDGSLRDIEYRVRTDADGYILPPSDPPGVEETVIFFGDSFVESVYVPEEWRFVAAIQAAMLAAGHAARCLNAGYSGATTLHMLMALLGKVGRRPKTTVVLVLPSNDALALVKKGGLWTREDKRYAPVVPIPNGTDAAAQPIDLVDVQAALNIFIDACRRLRLDLVLTTFPHRTAEFSADPWLGRRFKSAANYSRLLEWRCSVNAVARACANRLGLPFVDLEAVVSTHVEWFYDDLHMNETGSARVAQILSEFLIARRAGRPAAPATR